MKGEDDFFFLKTHEFTQVVAAHNYTTHTICLIWIFHGFVWMMTLCDCAMNCNRSDVTTIKYWIGYCESSEWWYFIRAVMHWPGSGPVAVTDTQRPWKRSVSNSCIHNIIISVFFPLLPPRYTRALYIAYMSQWVRAPALYCLLPGSHYLPASLPPLTFSDTEKLTPPLPSLLACFCPPFSTGRQTPYPFYSFLQSFTILSPICISHLTEHSGSVSMSTLPSPLCGRMSPSASLSSSLSWCFSAASTEKLVLPTNPLHAVFPPLSVHCSLHHSPSLLFSLSISPWEPTFFCPQYFMLLFPASPPPHVHLLSFASLPLISCASLLHISSWHISL